MFHNIKNVFDWICMCLYFVFYLYLWKQNMLCSYSFIHSFILESIYKHIFKDFDCLIVISRCDSFISIMCTCVFVYSWCYGSIWPGPEYPVPGLEGSMELALHREHPENHQTSIWDPNRKVGPPQRSEQFIL